MISVEEAVSHVDAEVRQLTTTRVALRDSLGLVLACDVASDIDSPSADKSLMDGYAVRSDDIRSGRDRLRVLEQVVAGQVATMIVEPGTATQVMTGVPLPEGADAVVMVEQTERDVNLPEIVRINQPNVASGQNIMRRGKSMQVGQIVLRKGQRIRGAEVGLLAEVGRGEVDVIRRASLAVVSTGNELVEIGMKPRIGFLRNSNGPMLTALSREAGADATEVGIARDNEGDLRDKISQGLASDILVLSGGVSAGVLDLVPRVLVELGVRQIFHKVRLKPGKPIWFGVAERSVNSGRTLVFGLPGNPVSSLVCFELFVRRAIEQLGGRVSDHDTIRMLPLTAQFAHTGNRPTYFPASIEYTNSAPQVRLLQWQGSADLRTLVDANGLVEFPAGDRVYEAGETVAVRRIGG